MEICSLGHVSNCQHNYSLIRFVSGKTIQTQPIVDLKSSKQASFLQASLTYCFYRLNSSHWLLVRITDGRVSGSSPWLLTDSCSQLPTSISISLILGNKSNWQRGDIPSISILFNLQKVCFVSNAFYKCCNGRMASASQAPKPRGSITFEKESNTAI